MLHVDDFAVPRLQLESILKIVVEEALRPLDERVFVVLTAKHAESTVLATVSLVSGRDASTVVMSSWNPRKMVWISKVRCPEFNDSIPLIHDCHRFENWVDDASKPSGLLHDSCSREK